MRARQQLLSRLRASDAAHADIGSQGLNTNCAWQESRLAVLWTIGVFALNFGPVIVGPILDYVGPKLTAILGKPPISPLLWKASWGSKAAQRSCGYDANALGGWPWIPKPDLCRGKAPAFVHS